MNNIEAVRTKYKGIWHRSKAEARWHYKFDKLGGFATYEDKSYYLKYKDGSNHTYTPDFHIKNVLIGGKIFPDLWVEVKAKPQDLNKMLDEKMRLFAEQVGAIIVVFDNPPCRNDKELRNAISEIRNTHYSPVGLYSFKYIMGVEDYKRNNEAIPCITNDGKFTVAKWNDKSIDKAKTVKVYDKGAEKFHAINGAFGKAWTKLRQVIYELRHINSGSKEVTNE